MNNRVVLCKKPRAKIPNIREMRPLWKSTILVSLYSPCKMGNLFSTFFLQKDAQNDYTRTTELFCAKKTLAKTPTSREMRPYWKSIILVKSIAHAKWASYFQLFFFAKTCWKWFYRDNRVALRKKPRAKTPNSRDLRAFWKFAILVSL